MRPLITLLFALLASPSVAQPLTGNVAIHDPTIAVFDDGMVSFATGVENAADGGQLRTKASPDGLDWRETGALPGGLPDWIAAELGFTPKNLWAPMVHAANGRHYLYYSASSFGRNDSAIGVMTNDGLDPADPTSGWVDQGLVIRSRAGDDFNAIDPFRIDTGGRAWLAFGSFWDGIRLVELDRATGKLLAGASVQPIASRGGGAIEAPAILEHGGRFYLFVSFDACCRGSQSTYRIMVGRSDTLAGPYLDRDGVPMLEGGGSELVKTTGRYRGPGGQEVFWRDGAPWLAFHYYDLNQGGIPKLYLAPLSFDADGWPVSPPLE